MDAVASLRRILAASPSLCTPTFVANVQDEIESSLNLKQVLVENADGVQYCDAFGRTVSYSPLSQSLPIPGHTETITVVKLGQMAMPALKITQVFGTTRRVSAFVPLGQPEPSRAGPDHPCRRNAARGADQWYLGVHAGRRDGV
ncbi:hypothetical protein N8D56_17175 [Devosia sp. A8/3-2]|nr:hypothetical protein N8D56_17175 [Devosia sp. A8/3-2]